jgi:tRNA(adenine34) deaminase
MARRAEQNRQDHDRPDNPRMNRPALTDEHWMHKALQQARLAAEAGEVPVGAVVVKGGQLLASGHNAPITRHDPTAHAEVQVLREAAKKLGNYRLDGCTLYVTLEPCAMCAGAMLHARVGRVVYGATEPKTGAAGSVTNLFALNDINHHTEVTAGVLATECSQPLQTFFAQRRQQSREAQLAAHPLRDDALRTPDARFDALAWPWPVQYVSDLPALAGLRMAWSEAGQGVAVTVCLHGQPSWSHIWLSEMTRRSATERVFALDLPGHGRSDKPKKAAAHSRAWQVQCVAEWLDRLDLHHVTLLLPAGEPHIGHDLQQANPRIARVQEVALQPLNREAQEAPYPDNGHKAVFKAAL